MDQLLQNLCSCGAGTDSASLDLGAELLVLDQLSGILHRKDDGTGIITFRRRRLAFLDIQ